MTAPISSASTQGQLVQAPTAPASSTAVAVTSPVTTAVPQARQKIRIGERQAQYLRSQANNILARGGSEADVIRFMRMEGFEIPGVEIVENPEHERPADISDINGRLRSLVQGVTFGFGDEAVGFIMGTLTGQGARAGIAQYRAELEEWAKSNALENISLEIIGSLLTGGGLIKLGAKALGIAGRTAGPVVTALGQGALGGAVFGAGQSESAEDADLLEVLSDRAKGALFGGAAGGVLGGGLVAGTGFVGRAVVRPLTERATKAFPGLQRRLPGVRTPEEQSRRLLAEELRKDGIDIEEAILRIEQAHTQGVPLVLADVGGDSVMKLAQDALRHRNPQTTEFLNEMLARGSETGERLTARLFRDLFRNTKMGLRNAYHTVDDLKAARTAASKPLYNQAYQESVPVSDKLKRILKEPVFRDAYREGKLLADAEDALQVGVGKPVPPIETQEELLLQQLRNAGVDETRLPAALRQAQQGGAGATFPDDIPVRALDYMKSEVQRNISRLMRDERLGKRRGALLLQQLEEVLQEVDRAVPKYGEARAVFRGFSEADRAVESGLKSMKLHPTQIQQEMAKLDPGMRDFYRLGAAQSLYNDVLSAGETTNVARRFFGADLFGNRDTVQAQRIRALFGDDARVIADDFSRAVAGEARISESTRSFASRQPAGSIQSAEEVAEGALPAVRATPGVALVATARDVLVRNRARFAEDVADELSLALAKGLRGPDEAIAYLRSLQATVERGRRAAARPNLAALAAGGQIGGISR